MRDEVINLIYPRRCPICEDILTPKDKLIHKDCRSQLVLIAHPKCLRCGKPVETKEQEYCFDCSKKSFHYTRGFPCMKYDQNMSRSISAFKYKGKKEYADFYVDEILKAYEDIFRRSKLDVLVPVPIHKTKYRERGYNQAELIATGIGQKLKIAVDIHLLQRIRKTLPQKELDDKERLKNLEQAFVLNRKEMKETYHKVLLVDDIYTTGSTIEACAKLLMDAGVREVMYTSICIGQGY